MFNRPRCGIGDDCRAGSYDSRTTVGDSQPSRPRLKGRLGNNLSREATDFSSARRRRHYRRGGNAAGLAFMGLAVGAIGAIAAQQRRNDYYNNGYEYGYAPSYMAVIHIMTAVGQITTAVGQTTTAVESIVVADIIITKQ